MNNGKVRADGRAKNGKKMPSNEEHELSVQLTMLPSVSLFRNILTEKSDLNLDAHSKKKDFKGNHTNHLL